MPDPSRLTDATAPLCRWARTLPQQHQADARRLTDAILVEVERWGLDMVGIMDAAEERLRTPAACRCHVPQVGVSMAATKPKPKTATKPAGKGKPKSK